MAQPKTLPGRANVPIVMAILAVLALAAAVWVSTDQDGGQRSSEAGSLMLPEFREAIADVESVALSSSAGRLTLQKQDGDWRILERDGYLADPSKVNDILLGLARAKLQEQKTGDPDRLSRIGLGDAATVIEVGTAKDTPLFILTTGNNTTRGADRSLWTFVMRSGETYAWLVSGLPELSADPADYIEKTVARVSSARVGRIEVSHESGDSYTLSRPDPMAAFKVDQIGDGEEFFAPDVAAATAAALDGLQADDVGPRESAGGEPIATLATMNYSMWDGLRVHLRLFEDAERARWVTLDASYDESAAMATDAPHVMLDAPPDGAAEAEDLNAQWAHWRYKIPSGFGEDDLARPRADFVSSEEPTD